MSRQVGRRPNSVPVKEYMINKINDIFYNRCMIAMFGDADTLIRP